VRRTLSPEFINRVHFVHFLHLTRDAVDRIFDLELGKIRRRYREAQGLDLSVTPAARLELLRLGYSHDYGARNLAKVLNRHANIEVSKALKRDENRQYADVSEVVAVLRDMREGRVAIDLDEVHREVERVSRIQVPYGRVAVDFREGEFAYDRG
jgi:ATP-dependent Clp protease ATP-binding subunit ClpA